MSDCPAREQLALLLDKQQCGLDAEPVEAHVQILQSAKGGNPAGSAGETAGRAGGS